LTATALDIVEPAESVTHSEQILTIGRLGRNGRLSSALEAAQRVARLHAGQTRPTEAEPRYRQQFSRSNYTFLNNNNYLFNIV